MTAGSGVVHSEMFPLMEEQSGNPLELFQIWLNLPRKNKMAPPYFSMYWNEMIPRVAHKDESGRETQLVIFAGRHPGAEGVPPPPDSWAADPESNLKIMTIRMDPGAEWILPASNPGIHRVLYFFEGESVSIADGTIAGRHAVLLASDAEASLRAGSGVCELLLLEARPIGEPVAQYGPFVMNTELEIHQAFEDYRRTQFGGWPWPDDAPVHERNKGRFARHADGRVETPPESLHAS